MTQARQAKRPVFRFAPSPNGRLHLGHALSALVNLRMAREAGGVMLLRIEDIDRVRCTPKLEALMLADLEWIGFEWDEPPRRQSEHFGEYKSALDGLEARGLVYPAFMSRGQIKAHAAAHPHWPKDPDGAPLYPGKERELNRAQLHKMMGGGEDFALRLDMARAIAQTGSGLRWQETGMGPEGQNGLLTADPLAWGDVILGRKDVPASYHLSCVLDDASQGVTHVVRGADLFHATSVHCVLQDLLGLPRPVYHHHRLVPGPDGRKLSKSRADTALCHLREAGATPQDIRRIIGL